MHWFDWQCVCVSVRDQVGATLCLSSSVYPSWPSFARQGQLRFLLCVEQIHLRTRPRPRTFPATTETNQISKRGKRRATIGMPYDCGVDVLPQLDSVINSHAKLG